MTEQAIATFAASAAEIKKNSMPLGVCPDCHERELVRTEQTDREANRHHASVTTYTCRNCGYQDERLTW